MGTCRRDGSRFLNLQLRRIVEHMSVWTDNAHLSAMERLAALRDAPMAFVANAPGDVRHIKLCTLVLQAFFHSTTSRGDKFTVLPQYQETSRIWTESAEAAGLDCYRAYVQAPQALKAAVDAYVRTDVSNFTSRALAPHCKCALTYLFPAHKKVIRAALTFDGSSATNAATAELPDVARGVIAWCENLLDDGLWKKYPDARFGTTVLLRMFLKAEVAAMQGIVERGEDGGTHAYKDKAGIVHVIQPKLFDLAPVCRKAAPFVRVCKTVLLELKVVTKAELALETTTAKDVLGRLLNLEVGTLRRLCAQFERHSPGQEVYPHSVMTDGTQLHVPFERLTVITEAIAATRASEAAFSASDRSTRTKEKKDAAAHNRAIKESKAATKRAEEERKDAERVVAARGPVARAKAVATQTAHDEKARAGREKKASADVAAATATVARAKKTQKRATEATSVAVPAKHAIDVAMESAKTAAKARGTADRTAKREAKREAEGKQPRTVAQKRARDVDDDGGTGAKAVGKLRRSKQRLVVRETGSAAVKMAVKNGKDQDDPYMDFGAHRVGLFDMKAARFCTAISHPMLIMNAVGVDPGERALVTAVHARRPDVKIELTKEQYYTMKRRGDAMPRPEGIAEDRWAARVARRKQRWKKPRLMEDIEEELSRHPLGVGDHDTHVANLTVWIRHSRTQQAWYGSRNARARAFQRSSCARRALQHVVTLVAPHPKTVVAFGANYFGRGCRHGDSAGPACVKAIRRMLAKHRRVVLIDEYNTTKMHYACRKELVPHADPKLWHERSCVHCAQDFVHRDTNAALNILRVWTTYVQADVNAKTEARPTYLSRPTRQTLPLTAVSCGVACGSN